MKPAASAWWLYVLAEGSSLLIVQGVRRGDTGVDHVALVELELHIAGDGLFQAVGKGIQSLAQRGEPLAVVNDVGILLSQLILEVCALLVQGDGLQNIDGLVQDGTAGVSYTPRLFMPTRRFSTISSRPMPFSPPSLFRYSTSSTAPISLPSTAVGTPFSKWMVT